MLSKDFIRTDLDRKITKLADALEDLYAKGVPFAVRQAINKTAFEARKKWVKNAESQFILRNKWTTRNMRVIQAPRSENNINKIEATLGSPLDYMRQQEFGGVRKAKGKYGVPIPTTVASGEGQGVQPRRKTVRQRYLMSSIALHRRVTGSRQRKNTVAIIMALKSGSRVAFLEVEAGRKGIFRVRGNKKQWNLEMLWDMSHGIMNVGPHPTLGPATNEASKELPRYLVSSLGAQVLRQQARVRR